jgi:hypothetical protein
MSLTGAGATIVGGVAGYAVNQITMTNVGPGNNRRAQKTLDTFSAAGI